MCLYFLPVPPSALSPPLVELSWEGRGTSDREQAWGAMHLFHSCPAGSPS